MGQRAWLQENPLLPCNRELFDAFCITQVWFSERFGMMGMMGGVPNRFMAQFVTQDSECMPELRRESCATWALSSEAMGRDRDGVEIDRG